MFVFQIALSSRNQFISEFWEKPFFVANNKTKVLSSKGLFDLLIYAVKMTIRTVDILKVLNLIRFLLSI